MSRIRTTGRTAGTIPELDADPASPTAGSAWVLHSGGPGGALKAIFGLGFPIIRPTTADTYDLSYRTTEGTTVRVPLT